MFADCVAQWRLLIPVDLFQGAAYRYGAPPQHRHRAQCRLDRALAGRSKWRLSWDSQNNLSVTDQEKLALYKNAADYAKDHNIALGKALSDDQVKALDAPMLWYVEQAVPDPRCTLASTICPTVNALVPQIYLPEGYAQALAVPTGGTISGENIKLTVDGQLRNTGQVIAQDTLTVKAESIDLSPNVVSIGTNAYKAQGGWNVVTGTVVQPGGFLSAMHMDIEADSIRAINDAFRVTRADGSVDPDASAALVAQLKESLGLNYTEGTVADDIHTLVHQGKEGLRHHRPDCGDGGGGGGVHRDGRRCCRRDGCGLGQYDPRPGNGRGGVVQHGRQSGEPDCLRPGYQFRENCPGWPDRCSYRRVDQRHHV